MSNNKTNYGELPELMAAQVDATLWLINEQAMLLDAHEQCYVQETVANCVLTCLAIQAEETRSDHRLMLLGVASFLCAIVLALLLTDFVWYMLVRMLVNVVLWLLVTGA